MNQGPTDPPDPFEDPFGEYEPSLAFALVASEQATERFRLAESLIASHVGQNGTASNAVAASARKSCSNLLARMMVATERCEAAVERARQTSDQLAHGAAVQEALEAFQEVSNLYTEIQAPASALLAPDDPDPTPVDPPLPPVHSWLSVTQMTMQATLAWGSRVRQLTGQVLILRPSPSAGKTEAMLDLALQEQGADQRVIFAARTKDVLIAEVEPRIKRKRPFVRLHVIQGRNEDTCPNFANVSAVQAHGYAPCRSVCLHCEHFPQNAPYAGVNICPYYMTRIRAQNDSMAARRGMNSFPIILTTHAGLISAQNSGGGHYGKFWPSDLILLDEDPTEAFEPETIVTERHTGFASRKPEDRAANTVAAALRHAIGLAKIERQQMQSLKWRDQSGKPSRIHHANGSVYAGHDLHRLLERVVSGAFGQAFGVRSVMEVMRDAADAAAQPSVGALLGAVTPEEVNKIIPPSSLRRIGEALCDELELVEKAKLKLYEKVRGKRPAIGFSAQAIEDEIDAHVEMFDIAYRSRLEFAQGEWRFVVQDFADLVDHEANIVIGDAYAHIEHYRQLLKKPARVPTNPAYQDPVTVVEHVARFPEGTLIARIKTKANITYLRGEGRQEHLARLHNVFSQYAGKSVLVYGHKSLQEDVEHLFEVNDNFGTTEWAFEHWWGGRGKDHYKHFDAVVTISEPLQNFDGLLHKVNARAARAAADAVVDDQMLAEAQRVSFSIQEGKATIANQIRHPKTHWRVQQEHERQNVNELAQALHRVRGLIAPKQMVVIGQDVELTRDVIAGSVTFVDPITNAPDPDSGTGDTLVVTEEMACISPHEMRLVVTNVSDYLGVWSPVFSHAFLAMDMGLVVGNARFSNTRACNCSKCVEENGDFGGFTLGTVIRTPNYSSEGKPPPSDRIHLSFRALRWEKFCENPPDSRATASQVSLAEPECVRSMAHPTLSLMERVWSPPPNWEQVSVRGQQSEQYKRGVLPMLKDEFRAPFRIRPTWWPKSQHGAGYAVYSKHAPTKAMKLAQEILNDQYGPTVGGRVVAPRSKPFIPF